MTVTGETEAEIRRLYYAEHWKVGTIAMQLGVHRDVVRRVLGYPDRRHSTIARPRKLDSFLPFVVETLEQYPRLQATRIYDMVRARGYQGSIRTLREQVRAVRPRPGATHSCAPRRSAGSRHRWTGHTWARLRCRAASGSCGCSCSKCAMHVRCEASSSLI